MTKHLNLFLVVFFLIWGITACDDNSTEPKNTTQANFTIKLHSNTNSPPKLSSNKQPSDTSFYFEDMSGTLFTINEARVNVRHIQFDLPQDDSTSTDTTNQISIDGPLIIDLMTAISVPDIGSFTILPGIYRRIDIRLDDTKADDGLVTPSDILFDNTLVVQGKFDYDGNPNRNYTIILKFNEDVRFEEPAGIHVEESSTTDILLRLIINEWFQGVDITSCLDSGDLTVEPSGDLIIDDSSGSGDCQNIEQTIKNNIKNNYDFN